MSVDSTRALLDVVSIKLYKRGIIVEGRYRLFSSSKVVPWRCDQDHPCDRCDEFQDINNVDHATNEAILEQHSNRRQCGVATQVEGAAGDRRICWSNGQPWQTISTAPSQMESLQRYYSSDTVVYFYDIRFGHPMHDVMVWAIHRGVETSLIWHHHRQISCSTHITMATKSMYKTNKAMNGNMSSSTFSIFRSEERYSTQSSWSKRRSSFRSSCRSKDSSLSRCTKSGDRRYLVVTIILLSLDTVGRIVNEHTVLSSSSMTNGTMTRRAIIVLASGILEMEYFLTKQE